MEITQQVRDYAAKLNESPEMAAQTGMAETNEKFKEMAARFMSRHRKIGKERMDAPKRS
jgi:hypothetical protein